MPLICSRSANPSGVVGFVMILSAILPSDCVRIKYRFSESSVESDDLKQTVPVDVRQVRLVYLMCL